MRVLSQQDASHIPKSILRMPFTGEWRVSAAYVHLCSVQKGVTTSVHARTGVSLSCSLWWAWCDHRCMVPICSRPQWDVATAVYAYDGSISSSPRAWNYSPQCRRINWCLSSVTLYRFCDSLDVLQSLLRAFHPTFEALFGSGLQHF